MKKDKKKLGVITPSMILQLLLSVGIFIIFLFWLFKDRGIVNYLWLLIGLDLLITGYNNEILYKRNGMSIYYFIVGVACIGYAIIKFIGV